MLYTTKVLMVALSAFIPSLPMLAVFHFFAAKKDKKNDIKPNIYHDFGVYAFCFTLLCVLSVTFVPDAYSFSLNPKINTVFFAYFPSVWHQYLLNVLLFIPIGFLLPTLWKRFEKIHLVLIFGTTMSLFIETLQLFNDRVSDVDDLLMNTFGAIVGYCIFMCIKKISPKISRFSIENTHFRRFETFFCFCLAWISMLFFQAIFYNIFVTIYHAISTGLVEK